jgi:hypothetical protein
MARYKIQGIVQDKAGNVISGATIMLYVAGGTTALNAYAASTGGSHITSVTSDVDGTWSFWLDTGDYGRTDLIKLVSSKANYDTQTLDYLPGLSLFLNA